MCACLSTCPDCPLGPAGRWPPEELSCDDGKIDGGTVEAQGDKLRTAEDKLVKNWQTEVMDS